MEPRLLFSCKFCECFMKEEDVLQCHVNNYHKISFDSYRTAFVRWQEKISFSAHDININLCSVEVLSNTRCEIDEAERTTKNDLPAESTQHQHPELQDDPLTFKGPTVSVKPEGGSEIHDKREDIDEIFSRDGSPTEKTASLSPMKKCFRCNLCKMTFLLERSLSYHNLSKHKDPLNASTARKDFWEKLQGIFMRRSIPKKQHTEKQFIQWTTILPQGQQKSQ